MTTTITLESIKAEHIKLGDMIAAFEKQQEPPTLFFPEVTINHRLDELRARAVRRIPINFSKE